MTATTTTTTTTTAATMTATTIVWFSVLKLTALHVMAAYGVYVAALEAHYASILWAYAVAMASAFGILSGAHRLWSHRSYSARVSLRVLLMLLQTMALQNDIYEWVRDHRAHHKFAETDADPHNARRGFFFAHMGWLMVKKHPQVIRRGQTVDMRDVADDPVVAFQRRYYLALVAVIWGVAPTLVPTLWSESLRVSFALNMARYAFSLHASWLVNSAAHWFGNRPYDRSVAARENRSVAYLSLGEGYHNFHHTFPYDYSASEFGPADRFNLATAFIDVCALLGLAYDRKVVSREAVNARRQRTGKTADDRSDRRALFDLWLGLAVSAWPIWTTLAMRACVAHSSDITSMMSFNRLFR